MNGRYSIRREPESIELPFGATGVAAASALVAGLIGLLLPTSILETLSFHLYLDTITDFAKPPLGTTAKLLGALALALVAGGVAFVAARWFDVTATPDGLSGLFDRIRGVGRDDEDDAPPLRSADRHPDAPARRPFSAMRDIPDNGRDDQDETAEDFAQAALADDDEELLLDMAFAPQAEGDAVMPVADAPDFAAEPEIEQLIVESEPVALATPVADPMDDFELMPPSLDDWEAEAIEVAPPAEAVIESAPEEDFVLDDVVADEPEFVAAPPPRPTARRETAPLDLSAARLDDLIARLEAGLTRRTQTIMPSTETAIETGDDVEVMDREPEIEMPDDPAFPHDPALAAALATLRKMNQRAG